MKKLLEEDIIYADEAHHDVFTEGEKGRQLKQTYIWMFLTAVAAEKKIVLYVHKGGSSGKIASEFLKDYHGYLQSDDYAGYNGLEGTRVLCHAHIRRKFADNVKEQKGNGSVEVVGEVIKRYKSIFKADNDVRKECENEYILIKDKRETVIHPKLNELFKYLDGIIDQVLEKSELYKAIQYARTNKEQLYIFLEDGRLELTNNLSERSQKPVILGRKNSMFMGSARGAQSSAMI